MTTRTTVTPTWRTVNISPGERAGRIPHPPLTPTQQPARGGHGWMMVACCVPMLVIAIALVAAGAVSASWMIAARACTAMMALMMRGMHDS